MKVLPDYDCRFNTKDGKIFIEGGILQIKNPRIADVAGRIELLKRF